MPRYLNIAGAQMGAISRNETRKSVVARMVELMHEAHSHGAEVVVFPELTLTSFFPRWWMEDQAEIDSFFESEMPSKDTQLLFETAQKLGVGFYIGYGELATIAGKTRRFNTSIIVNSNGEIVGKYRKIHLPGHSDHRPEMPYQHLEKLYFEVGDLGFGTWDFQGGKFGMAICNDRRWPETYRVMALQGAEVVVLGYNTPTHIPWEPIYDHLSSFHNHLCMQAGAYQNSMYVVGIAHAGAEEGTNLLAGSCIIAPSGEIIALSQTNEDEVIVAKCDLDICQYNRKSLFNFSEHRQVQHYKIITEGL